MRWWARLLLLLLPLLLLGRLLLARLLRRLRPRLLLLLPLLSELSPCRPSLLRLPVSAGDWLPRRSFAHVIVGVPLSVNVRRVAPDGVAVVGGIVIVAVVGTVKCPRLP